MRKSWNNFQKGEIECINKSKGVILVSKKEVLNMIEELVKGGVPIHITEEGYRYLHEESTQQ